MDLKADKKRLVSETKGAVYRAGFKLTAVSDKPTFKKPWYKKWWVWGIVSSLVGGGAAAVGGGMADCPNMDH